MRIGGYMRTQDKPADYEQFLTQQTAVHPKFKSGFTDPVTTVRACLPRL